MSGEPRPRRDLDWLLVAATVVLALIGVAFVHSATQSGSGFAERESKQATYLLVALAVGALLLRFDYRRLVRFAPWAYALGLVLLVAVLVAGHEVGGAKAWLRVGGFSLQPAELMKVATVLMLAHVGGRQPGPFRLRHGATLAAIVALPVGLILLQPDAGTALTFGPLLAATIFVSGLRWRWIVIGALTLALMAPVGWPMLPQHQKNRIRLVVNPELDPSGMGYHSTQSRIAVGSGGFTGQGYRQGPQNRLGFLPERHTDFIYAIIAEEWGFLGAVAVLGLYLLIVKRLVDAAALARERLGALLCLGAAALLSVHVVVNVGMVIGVLPTIGIPLPLLSYGGTSLLATTCLIALALNVRMRRFGR